MEDLMVEIIPKGRGIWTIWETVQHEHYKPNCFSSCTVLSSLLPILIFQYIMLALDLKGFFSLMYGWKQETQACHASLIEDTQAGVSYFTHSSLSRRTSCHELLSFQDWTWMWGDSQRFSSFCLCWTVFKNKMVMVDILLSCSLGARQCEERASPQNQSLFNSACHLI